ncbi:MAG: hypothetical protein R2729_22060 [Bryobacteraceae bacterium]
MRTAILLAIAGTLTAAGVRVRTQQEDRLLGGPIAGYSIGADIRVILGAPGATHYSAPFAVPAGVNEVRVGPGHEWLIAFRGEGESTSVWMPDRGVEFPLADVRGEGWEIGFGGGEAVFYSRAEARALVYRGLPDAPELAAAVNAADWPAGLERLVVHGTTIAAAARNGDVWLLAADGEPAMRQLADGVLPGSILFEPGSERLLALAAGRLVAVEAPKQGTGAVLVMEIEGGFSARARLFAGDAGSLFIADPAGRVIRLDPATGTAEATETGPFDAAVALRWHGNLLLEGKGDTRIYSGSSGERLHWAPVVARKSEVIE